MLVRRLDEYHDMTYGRGLANYARDAESVRQRVDTRLQLLLGEWFLDTSAGVPYLQEILVKPADPMHAEAIIKRCITETDGVESIVSFELLYDANTRRATITAVVRTIYGDVDILVGKPARDRVDTNPYDNILTEDGGPLLTEDGDFLLLEF